MLALLAAIPQVPTYRILDLGLPPGPETTPIQAVALNNRGEVLLKTDESFLWRKGQFLPLGPSTYRSLQDGGSTVQPKALNDRSLVVGSMGNTGPIFMSGLSDIRAFIWKGKSTLDIGTGLSTEAAGVNNWGDLAGSGDHRGFVRLKGKVWSVGTLSHIPAGNFSEAVAINDHRLFLGTSSYGKARGNERLPSRPFLADGNHVPFRLRPLPLPKGFVEAAGVDLNAHGTALAFAYNWTARRALPYLVQSGKLLPLALPGKENVLSTGDLNAHGDVVCTAAPIDRQEDTRPQLWLNGRHVDFPRFEGWKIQTATGINDHRQICGTALHDGKPHAYLLIPQ